jgi:hypothetical protein
MHIKKWGERESNPQPSDYEPPALTIELSPLKLVPRAGFAPALRQRLPASCV